MAKLEFLKNQVLVTKGTSRVGKPALAQVVFDHYLDVPKVDGAKVLDCVVSHEGHPIKVDSNDLANVMWAEEVIARRTQGFGGF